MKPFIVPLKEAITPAPPAGSKSSSQETTQLVKQDAERANKFAAQALSSIESAKKALEDLRKIASGKAPALNANASKLLNAINLLDQHQRGLQTTLPILSKQPEKSEEE